MTPISISSALLIIVVFLFKQAIAVEMVFKGSETWSTWQAPYGLTEIGENGQLKLVKYRKNIDVIKDAHLFSYESKSKGWVSGGLWEVGSNDKDALKVIDGDNSTYWKPDPTDEVEDWAIEVDLGRTVLASEIKIVFPNDDFAKPFKQFTVYVSTGARISVKEDVVMLEPVFRTTRPNEDLEIVIPLYYTSRDSALILDSGIDIDSGKKNNYRVVQRIRIEAEEKTADAALAEISVRGVGDNISIGTLQRGGFVNGINSVDPKYLFDGDMNTNNLIGSSYGSLGWKDGGVWFGVDLGATFFVDEFFLYSFKPDEGLVGYSINGTGPGYTVLYSDGAAVMQSGLPIPDAFDYNELFTHENPNADRLLYIRYLFKPRKMRYFFWHGIRDTGWGIVKWGEFMLFSPGHPAEVVLSSSFIDLGAEAGDNRPKVIKALHWDADIPASSKLQLRSRSGNTLAPLYTFFDRKGDEVTEERWNSAPKVLRGPIDTTLVIGEDWGDWSNVYQVSGESFQSESPRRYVLLEMILSTEDPEVAPEVNSLSIEYEDALIQQARGYILPREAPVNELTTFSYKLWPQSEKGDSGFSILRLVVPGIAEIHDDIQIRVSSELVQPNEVKINKDSLIVSLPTIVKNDSLEVIFQTSILQNATLVSMDVGLESRPGLWQSVEPAVRRGNVIMLPDLIGKQSLVQEVISDSRIFSPNDDGVRDHFEVSFVVYKAVDTRPQLHIFDVAGNRFATIRAVQKAGGEYHVRWDGCSNLGNLVPPGTYIYKISLDTDTHTENDQKMGTLAITY